MRRAARFMTILLAAALTQVALPTYASNTDGPHRAKTTAYTAGVAGTGTITASGKQVREGYIATQECYLGAAAFIWKDEVDENGEHHPGEFIGLFDCEDTGGPGVQNGVIDVYRDTYDRCVEWMQETQGECWVYIVPAQG